MTAVDALLPAVDHTPVWGIPDTSRAPLSSTMRCGTVVIGAGIAGLSLAYNLSRLGHGDDIVVIDAGTVGSGASGRGTGLVGPRLGPPLHLARKRLGDNATATLHRWSERAVEHVVEICAHLDRDCEVTPCTQLVVARDPSSRRTLELEHRAGQELGLSVPFVAIGDCATTSDYPGLRYTAATVNPRRYLEALAQSAERRGVRIFEQSPVRSVIGTDRVKHVHTDRGGITADRVILTVNGSSSYPIRRTGVVGLRVQAAATAPLPPAILADVQHLRSEPILEKGTVAAYYRLTRDDRVIVGGGHVRRGHHGGPAPDLSYLTNALRRLHPKLDTVELTHAWSGPIGMTLDNLPVVGERPDGIIVAAGWCGHGIAASSYVGATLAEHLAHRDRDVDRSWSTVFPLPRAKARELPRSSIVDRALDIHLSRISGSEAKHRPVPGSSRPVR